MKSVTRFLVPCLAFALLISVPRVVVADGCAPGQPCWKKKAPGAPMKKEAPAIRQEPPPLPPPAVKTEPAPIKSGLNASLGLGVNLLFFDCEDTKVAPGIRVNYEIPDVPLNVQLGFEGTHVGSRQFRYANPQPFEGANPHFNLFRIPLSLEYIVPITDETRVFLGGGPDLFHLNGRGDDTEVGLHLGARVEQAFTDSLALSVDSGYLWAEAQQKGGTDTDLDSAFLGTFVNYKF